MSLVDHKNDPMISEKDLANLKEQLNNMQRDRDRIRLVQAAADSFRFTCNQLAQVISVQRFGESKNQTAILIYPRLTDPEKFPKVLELYKFEEDKQEIREALGL